MENTARPNNFWSERFWPIFRAILLQLVLMSGIFGNLAGWLVLALLVDQLHILDIDFHGKTLSTISPDGRALGVLILTAVNALIVLLAWRFLEKKLLPQMLLQWGRSAWRPLGLGLLAGLGEVLVVYLVLLAGGFVKSSLGLGGAQQGSLFVWVLWFLGSSVMAPFAEELLNRGYWFQNIRRGWGTIAAIVVTSLLFGALHQFNENAALLGALNIALSAAIWAIGMLWFRSLWFPIGWHAGWNFVQFFIIGLPNSGFSVADFGLQGTTLLVTELTGPTLMTGGEFGIEASLVSTLVYVVILIGLAAYQLSSRRSTVLTSR